MPRIVSLIVLGWAMWLITVVTLAYLDHMGKVGMPDATIIASGVIGLLATAIGYRKWSRDK